MNKLGVFLAVLIATTSLVVRLWASPCSEVVARQAQKQTVVADPKYVEQIELARRAALEIYDHGFLGNSSSAINNKLGHPPGMTIAVAVDGRVVWGGGIRVCRLRAMRPCKSIHKISHW